jgi:hypothetical protein
MEIQANPGDLRVRTAETLAQAMNHAGIEYAVISGLEGYPHSVGRDLDVLIRREDTGKAVEMARIVSQSLGWDSILLHPSPYDLLHIFFLKREPEKLVWFEVDLMHERAMLMGATPLFPDFDRILRTTECVRGPFRTNKVSYYTKAQLRPICYGHLERFEKYALDPVDDAEIQEYLKELLGARCAQQLIAGARQGISGVRGMGSKLRWAMNLRYGLRNPVALVRNILWTRIGRPWQVYWRSTGIVFAIAHPELDDAQTAKEAVRYFNGCFEVRSRRFSERPQAAAGGRVSLLQRSARVLLWLVRLNLTYYLQDRFVARAVIQCTLYLGSPGDVTQHPESYGLTRGAEMRMLQRWAPQPIEIGRNRGHATKTQCGNWIAEAVLTQMELRYSREGHPDLNSVNEFLR